MDTDRATRQTPRRSGGVFHRGDQITPSWRRPVLRPEEFGISSVCLITRRRRNRRARIVARRGVARWRHRAALIGWWDDRAALIGWWTHRAALIGWRAWRRR